MTLPSNRLRSLIAIACILCAVEDSWAGEEVDVSRTETTLIRLDGGELIANNPPIPSQEVEDVNLDELLRESEDPALEDLDSLLGERAESDQLDDEMSLGSLEFDEERETDDGAADDALSLDGLGNEDSDAVSLSGSLSAASSWADNLRKSWDLSVRPRYDSNTHEFAVSTFVGLDIHKVFTDDDGDWGTLILQPYLTRIDNLSPQPAFFDDPHDFELICRICNFNYTRHGRGKTNFRVGHFEVPFGLEQIVNTNGTLRDFTSLRNFGLKSDWGFSLNGETSNVEYEVSLTRGSGNGFRRRGGPYLVAGRVGTQRDNPIVIGASALHGQTYDFFVPGTTRRTRVGLDLTVGLDAFVWMTELSAGVDDDTGVFNALVEWDWHNSTDTVLIYNQLLLRGLNSDAAWDVGTTNFLGVRWHPTSKWSLSGQWEQSLHALQGEDNRLRLALQARYRF